MTQRIPGAPRRRIRHFEISTEHYIFVSDEIRAKLAEASGLTKPEKAVAVFLDTGAAIFAEEIFPGKVVFWADGGTMPKDVELYVFRFLIERFGGQMEVARLPF